MNQRNTFQARILGRVQGVAFRHWTRARAEALGLAGWVMNCEDGSVMAQFTGPRAALEAIKTELWSGPGAAQVRDVQIMDSPPTTPSDETPTGFTIRR